jgi:Protein of unknown function (DUF3500)
MDRAGFRDYVFPLDHPRIARLRGKDAHAHAQIARGDPRVQELLIEPWSRLITEPFTGITTDGTPVRGLFDLVPDDAPVAGMVSAARRLLDLLDDEGRERVLLPLDATQWRMWNNTEIYLFVYGLRMDEISPALRDAICDVLRASLSDRGYGKARQTMWLNGYLGELTAAPAILGEWSFNFTLFGEPSDREPWGWQLAGHHLALNCVIVDGQMVISPAFLGAEPNWAPEGPYGDAVLFADEERMGAELMASLSPELRRQAVVYDLLKDPAMPSGRWHQADQRHLGGAFRDNRVIPYEGVPVSAFSASQRQRLMALAGEFLVLPAGPRAQRLAEIERHLDDTHFCWIGETDGEHPFYYRIQSPVIMIEFDEHAGVFLSNEEPERFHIHTIVRTPNGNDYGMDLLRMHYAQEHPGHRPGA